MQKLPEFFSRLRVAYTNNKAFTNVPATTLIGKLLHLFLVNGVILNYIPEGRFYKVFFNPGFPINTLSFPGYSHNFGYITARKVKNLANFPLTIVSLLKDFLLLEKQQCLI